MPAYPWSRGMAHLTGWPAWAYQAGGSTSRTQPRDLSPYGRGIAHLTGPGAPPENGEVRYGFCGTPMRAAEQGARGRRPAMVETSRPTGRCPEQGFSPPPNRGRARFWFPQNLHPHTPHGPSPLFPPNGRDRPPVPRVAFHGVGPSTLTPSLTGRKGRQYSP